MSRATPLLLALAVLTVALPLAAPTASAYCVSTFCPPLCIICIIIAQEAASLACAEATDGATTSVSCGSWLTGTHGESVDAPVPHGAAGSYWAREGPSGQVAYGYALP